MARKKHYSKAARTVARYFIGIVLFLYALLELLSFLPLPIDQRYVFGLVLVALSVLLLYRRKGPSQYLNLTDRTEGNVSRIYASDIRSDTKSNQTNQDAYVPEFTYSVNDIEYVKRSDITEYDGEKFYEGQNVTILYNPKNPDQYYVLEQHRPSILPRIVSISWRPVGAIFFILGALSIILAVCDPKF